MGMSSEFNTMVLKQVREKLISLLEKLPPTNGMLFEAPMLGNHHCYSILISKESQLIY
jgi:hypothetical protein